MRISNLGAFLCLGRNNWLVKGCIYYAHDRPRLHNFSEKINQWVLHIYKAHFSTHIYIRTLSINSINFRRREKGRGPPIGSCNNVATILLQIYFIAFLEQESDNKEIFDNEPHLSKFAEMYSYKLGPLWQINCFQNDEYTSKASKEYVLKCTSDLKLIRIMLGWLKEILAGSNIRESKLYLFCVNIFCWVQSLGLSYDFKLLIGVVH